MTSCNTQMVKSMYVAESLSLGSGSTQGDYHNRAWRLKFPAIEHSLVGQLVAVVEVDNRCVTTDRNIPKNSIRKATSLSECP